MNNFYDQVMTTLYTVWRKRWYGLAAMWAVCLIGWIIVAMIPNQYESNARIYAKWSSLLPDKLGLDGGDKARQVDIVRQTLTSRPNLEKVVRRTGLDQGVDNDKELDLLIGELAENIIVTEQDGDLFTLSYTSKDADFSDAQNATMAQRVVQNLINIFVEENISTDRDNINQAIRFLEDQLAQRGRELEEAERRRAEFEVKYLGRLPGQGNVTSRLLSAQMEIDRIDQELIQARMALSGLSAQLASTPATLPTGNVGYEPGSARAQIEALERTINDGLARGWTQQHPDIVTARQQIARLRSQAAREGGGGRGGMANPAFTTLRSMVTERQSAIAALTARRAQLEAAMANMQNIQVEQPGIAAEMARVNRDYDVLRRQYDQLVKSREEVRLRSDIENKTDQVRFQIVDPPSLPRKPVAPNRPLLLTSVLLAGLLVGIGTAFVMSQVHTTYITPDRLQQSFDLPVLGSVSEVIGEQQRAQNRLWSRGFAVLAAGLVGAYALLLLYQVAVQGSVA
jgi:polysaccharide chain length determinant protein (PEP-CTERM system associated)